MTVTLQWWMLVPTMITFGWLYVAVFADDRDMVGFSAIAWLGMIVPALLVAWLK